MNKKGDYKYGIILSLILGLLVLGLSLFFIFNEYFTEEDTDRQICRQSIQVRALLPDIELVGVDVFSFKNDFPLKCKTMVKTIEKEDIEKNGAREAKKIIAEAMVECWALYDKGDSNAFPAEVFKTSTCVPCARIHLTEEAKKYMAKENVNISIRDSLDLPMGKGYTYYNFLMNSGDKFSAFNFGNGVPFDLEKDDFDIIGIEGLGMWLSRVLTNKIDGSTYDAWMTSVDVSLPRIFNISQGDLLINYGIVSIDEGDFGRYIPYLFYFQTNQERDPFIEVSEAGLLFSAVTVIDGKNAEVPFCYNWEGIPA